MTATPGERLKDFKRAEDKNLIKIPARYHGHPIPVPEILTSELGYNQKAKEIKLSTEVIELINYSIYQDLSQLFVFLPSRELAELVGKRLQEEVPKVDGQSWVQYSHARDSNRDQKRENFFKGKYPILVSTTIMERAITVPKSNVLVLFAEWNFVFDMATLIQMAGRAGRSAEYPEGKVWFVGQKVSREMKEAQNRIRNLNEEARRKGYLVEGN
jgi:competence protein ComFA